MNILIVVAHPDDEILMAGGTVAKLSKEHRIEVLILGTGITSRGFYDSESLHTLKKDAFTAADIVGIKDIHFYNFKDNMFDSESLLRIIKVIEEEIQCFKPETIFTHHLSDLNIDHRITFQAVMTSCRPIGSLVKKIYSGEVLSSTEWALENPFIPNTYINIKDTIETKVEAMRAYKGEIRDAPHPRSPDGIYTLAKKRGMEAGLYFAEAFTLVRSIE